MSLLARNALRVAGRTSRQVRSYSSSTAYRTYAADQEALSHHAAGQTTHLRMSFMSTNFLRLETTDLWRKIR